jgi:hypothetical protein
METSDPRAHSGSFSLPVTVQYRFDHDRKSQRRRFSHSRRMSHMGRATGITIYLENDGRFEYAKQAGHESPRKAKLYDRTKD